jgi:hypothetical protein
MFEADFETTEQLTKRQQNNYINLCEENLKRNYNDYKVLSKIKLKGNETFKIKILFQSSGKI